MGWDGVDRRKKLQSLDNTRCPHDDKISDMHLALYGNGHPEEGLLWMVKENTRFISSVQKNFNKILLASMVGISAAVINLGISVFRFLVNNGYKF